LSGGLTPLGSFGERKVLLLVAFLVTTSTVLFQGLQSIFLGLERMIEYNVIPIFFFALYLGCNFIALKVVKLGLSGVMLSWLLASVLAFLLSAFLLRKNVGIGTSFNKALLRSSLRLGSKGMLINLLLLLLFRADIYLVNYYLGAGLVGVYLIAVRFAKMLQEMPNIAGTVLFSKIASDATDMKDHLTAKVSRTILLVTFVVAVVIILLGRQLILLLFGVRFVDAYPPLIYMLPGILAVASGSVVNSYLWRKGYPIIALLAPALSLCINIGLNVLLIPTLGLIGAGLATSVAYILWGALIFGYFVRNSTLPVRDLLLVRISDLALKKG